MQVDTPERWRACRDFRLQQWPDGAVIYDPGSGDTHHLTTEAAGVLALLSTAPHTREELLNRVLSSSPFSGNPFETMDAILARLAELGLITPAQH